MSGSKYRDTTAATGVLASIYKNPSLLDDDGRYFFKAEDFTDDLHVALLGAFQRLRLNEGGKKFSIPLIEDVLQNYPESFATYKTRRGREWLQRVEENEYDTSEGFDYYYSRLKKFSLLREYEKTGLKVEEIYDPNEFDIKKKQRQEEEFDELTLQDISLHFENQIEFIHQTCIDNAMDESSLLGEGLMEAIWRDQLQSYGMPFYGKYMNTITNGMRRGKFFIRSAATGVGKTRSMVGDMCYLGCDEIWKNGEWVSTGDAIPCLFIATEQEKYEIQTMAIAFISGVDESIIIEKKWNEFDSDFEERIQHAVEVLNNSTIWIECIPDFGVKDIENCIKRHLTNPLKQVQYVFFDYIFTAPKMMREMKRDLNATREDQVLNWFSTKLKEIAVKYNVFVMTSTQVNKDWKDATVPDQNLIRGAKSIADKADWGSILMDVTEEDKEALKDYVTDLGCEMPNVKLSVYKNRASKYTKGYLWMHADKSTCRFDGLFWTYYNYTPDTIKDIYLTKVK